MRKDTPAVLAVDIPPPNKDKPGWVRVGVIAAVGFVIGIAWPKIAGVRLGPSAPGESAAAAAAAASNAAAHSAAHAPDAPPASVVAKAAPAPSVSGAPGVSASPTNALPPSITVQKGIVVSCKTSDGESKKGKECGSAAGLDLVVSPRIRKIASCSGVEGQTGKLSFVANADFNSGRFWYEVQKASTLPNLDAVSTCLKTSFHNTTVGNVPHEHVRYTVAYTAIFSPGAAGGEDVAAKDDKSDKSDKADKKAKDDGDKADKNDAPSPAGEATIAWEVALVRDTPKTGQIVGRLPRGTKVKAGASKDGWYAIKFGEGFATDGWVYRGAIGR